MEIQNLLETQIKTEQINFRFVPYVSFRTLSKEMKRILSQKTSRILNVERKKETKDYQFRGKIQRKCTAVRYRENLRENFAS